MPPLQPAAANDNLGLGLDMGLGLGPALQTAKHKSRRLIGEGC